MRPRRRASAKAATKKSVSEFLRGCLRVFASSWFALVRLARQSIEFVADRAHEWAERLGAEVEANTSGREQFGQRACAAQCQGRAVVGQRLPRVLARLHPQL